MSELYIKKLNGYKIKDDESVHKTDVVDNLTSSDTQNPLSAKQGKVLNEKLENFEIPKSLVCVTKIDNGETYNLALSISYDGINFGDITVLNGISIPHEHRNVAVNFCYENEKFYVLTSIGYWFSDDLVNWSEMKTFNVNVSAPSMYNGKLYAHYKESDEIIVNDLGFNTYPFSIKKYDITFNDDGTILLSNEVTLIQADSETSFIDPVVIDFNNVTYLACKDELKCIIKLYTLENNTLTDTGFIHRGIGIEACKLVLNGGNLYIYADPYGVQTNYENTTNVSYDRGLSVRMTAINSKGVNTDALLTPIIVNYEYHPAFALIDDLNAVRLINSLKYTPIVTKATQYYKQVNLSSNISNEVISVLNHPLRPLYITGNTQNNNAYLRFTKVFEDSPVLLRFDPSSGTTIHPAQGINGRNDTTSNDVIIRNNEIITAPIYNTGSTTWIYLPVEQYEYRRQLEVLPTNQSIQTSLNEKFLKANSINFFIISGYGTDITTNLLPSASNFFGEYYKQNNNFGHLKLYRIGDTVIEYQATISNGTLSAWTQTH